MGSFKARLKCIQEKNTGADKNQRKWSQVEEAQMKFRKEFFTGRWEQAVQGSGGITIPGKVQGMWLWKQKMFCGEHCAGEGMVGLSDLFQLNNPKNLLNKWREKAQLCGAQKYLYQGSS